MAKRNSLKSIFPRKKKQTIQLIRKQTKNQIPELSLSKVTNILLAYWVASPSGNA
jgi:hypothetical protein